MMTENPDMNFIAKLIAIGTIIVFALYSGTVAYKDYLNSYNLNQERLMIQKEFQAVIDCRKAYGIATTQYIHGNSSANVVCGQIPPFGVSK